VIWGDRRGGLIGAAVTFAIFNGISASTLGASFTQVVFSFRLTPALAGEGVVLAMVVGLIGGLLPGLRAARMPIVKGLYG
jgi:putative ABC transport system permease protein